MPITVINTIAKSYGTSYSLVETLLL